MVKGRAKVLALTALVGSANRGCAAIALGMAAHNNTPRQCGRT
jgi:hypothetical protein